MTQHSLSPKLERDRSRHDASVSRHGPLGTAHLFGNRSEGTGSPKNPSADNVRFKVGPYPRATLITSNLTAVSGRVSCNTKTHKAYVFVTTTRIGIKRDPDLDQCGAES